MRIAFFTETFLNKVDGIVTVLCLLFDHLQQRGVETVIFTPRYGEIDHYASTRVIQVPGFRVPQYPELKLSFPVLLKYPELRRFQPDLVHIVNPVVVGTGGLMMAKVLRVPVVASFHLNIGKAVKYHGVGMTEGFFNGLARTVFNQADYALAPSNKLRDEMRQIGIRGDIGIWQRGVDGEKFHPRHRSTPMREALSDGHPDETILLYVGRLSGEKQIIHLHPVLENVPSTRLAIVGDGPERAALEQQFAGLPAKFMGYLSGEALSQAYASADIFVFPSAMEAFGLVVTEAMAAGLPVIASQVGGVMDVVSEGITGLTFAPGDIPTLIKHTQRLSADAVLRAKMGAAGRAFAETQTWAATMDDLLAQYAAVIGRHTHRTQALR
jgi:glycosyltransferase involved in cell wall biosynthesis